MASTHSPIIAFSRKLYAVLLAWYPDRFRGEYGAEMATVFHDMCQAEYQHNGTWGVAKAWVETVPDLVVSVTDEHAQEDFQMPKTTLIRGLAIAGLIGGALWVAFSVLANMRPAGVLNGADRNTDDLVPLIGMAWGLMSVGLIGFYTRYSQNWSSPTKLFFILSILSGLEVFAGFLFNIAWPVWVFGWYGFMLGVLLTGLTLLTRPSERSVAVLLLVMALSVFFFNFENWQVLFGVAIGIMAVVFSALALGSSLPSRATPPTAPA